MTLEEGNYKCKPHGCCGEITMHVKETETSFIYNLIENTCRYSPGQIDMMFAKSTRAVNKKRGGSHPMRLVEGCHDWFVIYPFHAGIPFTFELVE